LELGETAHVDDTNAFSTCQVFFFDVAVELGLTKCARLKVERNAYTNGNNQSKVKKESKQGKNVSLTVRHYNKL